MKETWTWEICFPTVEKRSDQNKTRLRHVIKSVEFCGRQERISKKQDGRLIGRTPSSRGEYSQLFIYKLCAFLDYSNHKQFLLFKAFASITSAPHPLEKSWLRPWARPQLHWGKWGTCLGKLSVMLPQNIFATLHQIILYCVAVLKSGTAATLCYNDICL